MSKKKKSLSKNEVPDNYVGGMAAAIIGIVGVFFVLSAVRQNTGFVNKAAFPDPGPEDIATSSCKDYNNQCGTCIENGCQFCQPVGKIQKGNLGTCISRTAQTKGYYKCINSTYYCAK